MLEFNKLILKKISFDRTLFRKELIKSIKVLKKSDRIIIKMWCYAVFGHQYLDILKEVFEQ